MTDHEKILLPFIKEIEPLVTARELCGKEAYPEFSKDVLLALIRRMAPEKLADELASVQPINWTPPSGPGKTDKEMRAAGYRPACPISPFPIIWVKDAPNDQL